MEESLSGNIMDKVGEVVVGICRSEEYVAKLHRDLAEAQDQTNRHRRDMMHIKEDFAKLKEKLGPIKVKLAAQEATLLYEEMLLAEINKEVIKAEEKLKAAKLPLNEEKELSEFVETMMAAALDFSLLVRLDNQPLVAHMKSLEKALQELHLEETSLQCEIKVLQENEQDAESTLALSKRHENEMTELERSMKQKEKDLFAQLQSEKQLLDELSNPCNDTIQQRKSDLAVCSEEAECLEAAHNTLKKELDSINSDLEKLKEQRHTRPQKRPAASEFWTPPTDEWYPGNTLNEPCKTPRYESHSGYHLERSRGRSTFHQSGWKSRSTRYFRPGVEYNSRRVKVEKCEPSWSSRQNEHKYERDRNTSSCRTFGKENVPTPSTPKTFTRNPPPPTPVANKDGSSVPLHLLGGFMHMPGQNEKDNPETVSQDTSLPTSRGADYPLAPLATSTPSSFVEKTSEICHESEHQKGGDHEENDPMQEQSKSSMTSHHIIYKRTVVVHEDEAI